MGTRILAVGTVLFFVLALAAPTFGQEVWIDIQIEKLKFGASLSYDGSIEIQVEGEGITSTLLKHPSFANPVTLMQNAGGFKATDVERWEEWSVFTGLLPNGSYELSVKKGWQTIRHPFTLNHSLMPSIPNVTNPAHGQVLATPALVVTWTTPPAGIDLIYLDMGGENMEFSDTLAPTATSYTIPAGLLKPGESYELSLEFVKHGSGVDYNPQHEVNFSVAP